MCDAGFDVFESMMEYKFLWFDTNEEGYGEQSKRERPSRICLAQQLEGDRSALEHVNLNDGTWTAKCWWDASDWIHSWKVDDDYKAFRMNLLGAKKNRSGGYQKKRGRLKLCGKSLETSLWRVTSLKVKNIPLRRYLWWDETSGISVHFRTTGN